MIALVLSVGKVDSDMTPDTFRVNVTEIRDFEGDRACSDEFFSERRNN